MSGLDFFALGRAARVSAEDAHGVLSAPSADVAWEFMLANPECFLEQGPSMGAPELERDVECEWPADMPSCAPIAFYEGYYNLVMPAEEAL